MKKSAMMKKYTLIAEGILDICNDAVFIEITDTGESINLCDLLSDFKNKCVKLNVVYDEDYTSNSQEV